MSIVASTGVFCTCIKEGCKILEMQKRNCLCFLKNMKKNKNKYESSPFETLIEIKNERNNEIDETNTSIILKGK